MKEPHSFSFEGGEILTKMGATWFVSYSYYVYIDKTHLNWKKVKTFSSRASIFESSKKFHKFWLERVLEMDDERLKTNTIEVKPLMTKQMAKALLNGTANNQ